MGNSWKVLRIVIQRAFSMLALFVLGVFLET